MNPLNAIGGIIAMLAVAGLLWFVTSPIDAPVSTTTTVLSFEDCASAGYLIMESHPRQCRAPDGRTYAEELPEKATYTSASEDLIVVEHPVPGAVTGKRVVVNGRARGTWFFEASFPVELLDKDGRNIATGIAQAEGEWMTENFVPYRVTLEAPSSYVGRATLVLHKDNPSGLSEHDASVSIPITIE